MKYLSKSYVNICVFGDNFVPDELTKLLGLEPSCFGIKGMKGKYSPSLKESFWEYKLNETNAIEELEESIKQLQKVFENNLGLLKEFNVKYNLQVRCNVVISSKNNEHNGVFLNHEFISFLNDLKATIEISIYR